jgi:4-hydroxybenzoate polyprenyltransferase
MEVNVNATLPHAPRALAATAAAFALALIIALIAPAAIEAVQDRVGDRAASAPASPRTVGAPSPTWAEAPLASPLETLRESPR